MSGHERRLLAEGRASGLLSSSDGLEDVAVVARVYPNEVFFDETGANQEPVFMWCGLFANMSFWVQFSQHWRAILAESPPLPYWHQVEARRVPREPPFDVLNDSQLRDREEKLARLLVWRKQDGGVPSCAIVVRLPRVYFERYVKGRIRFGSDLTRRERREFGISVLERQHTIAFYHAALAAAHIASQSPGKQHVNFVVDDRDGDPYQAAARDSLSVARQVLREPHASLLGDLTFASSKSPRHVPLQAADMLAWHLGKRSRRHGKDDPMWHVIAKAVINEKILGVAELENYVDIWNS